MALSAQPILQSFSEDKTGLIETLNIGFKSFLKGFKKNITAYDNYWCFFLWLYKTMCKTPTHKILVVMW